MCTEMTSSLHIQTIYIYKLVFVVGLYATSLPQQNPAKFSVSSIFDSVMPALNPIVSGPNRCEALKSMFGLTYEQMQEKNSTNFHETLNIDLITKNGNVKYNLTSTTRLNKVLEGADTIVILVHGFLESSEGLMVNGLSPGLLRQPGLKILALDGRRLMNWEYFRSSTLARFIGEQLGTMLHDLINKGQDPSQFMIIGHSLGAHIAGIAGKQLRELSGKEVGRIIALDPAGPCFGNVGATGRLSQNDAKYVMVVHTNGGVLGLLEPIGHTDFYPNGGESQPGCYLSTCSHSRSWELLAEAIAASDHFPARRCKNYTMFQNGQCSKKEVSYLTLQSNPPQEGSYFFNTAASSPFGLGMAGMMMG